MYVFAFTVISYVITHPCGDPFKEPVNECIAPRYYEFIKNPMDLSTIQRKINDRVYVDFHQVENDFKLLVNNCEIYNGPLNSYITLAHELWRKFEWAVKEYLELDLSYDEKSAFIYQVKQKNRGAPKAAIEARKRKKRHKKLTALTLLEKAAKEAVKCTDRGANTDLSWQSICEANAQSTSSPEVSQPDSQKAPNNDFLAISKTFTFNPIASSLNQNLIFKPLSEWSEIFKQNNVNVNLPQHSVKLENENDDVSDVQNCLAYVLQRGSNKFKPSLHNLNNQYHDTQKTDQKMGETLSHVKDEFGNSNKLAQSSRKQESWNYFQIKTTSNQSDVSYSQPQKSVTYKSDETEPNLNSLDLNLKQLDTQQEIHNVTNFQALSFNDQCANKEKIIMDHELMKELTRLLCPENL